MSNESNLTPEERAAKLAQLRAPFPPNQISKLPKPYRKDSQKGNCPECGGWHGLPAAHLDYVGHAALTARLLDVDPDWSWEPLARDAYGNPVLDESGGLWIKLTVLGVTRLGYGDATNQMGGAAMKERIGDALRNAGMRFGIALDLWHKGDLYLDQDDSQHAPPPPARRVPPEPGQQQQQSEQTRPWTAAEIDQALIALKGAQDLDTLKTVFENYYRHANSAGRGVLTQAKDERKAELLQEQANGAHDPGAMPVPGAPVPRQTRRPRAAPKSPDSPTH